MALGDWSAVVLGEAGAAWTGGNLLLMFYLKTWGP